MKTKNPDLFRKIEAFIEEYASENGRSPSIREISEGTGMSSTNVFRYVQDMKERGVLDYSGTRSLKTQSMKKRSKSFRAPVLSSFYAVACGGPTFAEELIEEYVDLPESLFGRGEFFVLPTKGESMINAGINSGDYVLIRKQNTAEPGQIVVALTGDEATLKRYYPEPEHERIRLQPENDSMEPIYVTECLIQGIAVKVFKDVI